MKKETLEEAAERFVENTRLKNPKSLFCEGAKWQQERSYNEEEVLEMLVRISNKEDFAVRVWFEQFKKK